MYIITGTSGIGKSTRVQALVQFLETRKEKTEYLTYKERAIGRIYGDIAIIGKEVNRKGTLAWQGMDTFTSDFGSTEAIYKYLYDKTKQYHTITESAAILDSQRARPAEVDKCGVPMNVVHWYFAYNNFEEYKARILARSGNLKDESSAMWKGNKRYSRSAEKFLEEKALSPNPERYESLKGGPDDNLDVIGVHVLERAGRAELIPSFKDFCSKFNLTGSPIFEQEGFF